MRHEGRRKLLLGNLAQGAGRRQLRVVALGVISVTGGQIQKLLVDSTRLSVDARLYHFVRKVLRAPKH